MKHNLNNRFTLSSDKYNWILLDEQEGKKVKRSYFPNIKQLSRFIGELVAKESIDKAKVELGDIRTITRTEERRGGKECTSRWSPHY